MLPRIVLTFHCLNKCSSDLKIFANSRPSVSNFKSFSRSLEHFFLTVGQHSVTKNCSDLSLFEQIVPVISKLLQILSLQSRISKHFLNHQNNFFSLQVRTILVTKYHFLKMGQKVPSEILPPLKHKFSTTIFEQSIRNFLSNYLCTVPY